MSALARLVLARSGKHHLRCWPSSFTRAFSSTAHPPEPPKRKRGRPPGSKTKPSPAAAPSLPAAQTPGVASLWSWVPPPSSPQGLDGREDDEVIEVRKGVLLTGKEIQEALVRLGGEDVVVVPLLEKLDTITELVIVTGRSVRQIQKMANVVVHALKARGLKQALGISGAEGEREDDWVLVDCYNCVVHLMLPGTRAELGLEDHWGKLTNNERNVLYAADKEV